MEDYNEKKRNEKTRKIIYVIIFIIFFVWIFLGFIYWSRDTDAAISQVDNCGC
jgi:hypothetical protein